MHRRELSKALFACATGAAILPERSPARERTAARYPPTAAELALGLTPVDLSHAPASVLRYGADPTGVADSAAAFLNARKVATQAGIELLIPGGTYKSTSTLAWGFTSLCVRAAGKVTITFTNRGQCITIDGGAGGVGINGVQVLGYIRVIGNTATTDAWFVRACHHSHLQMRAGDCTTALRTQWCVLTIFEITCSANEAPFRALMPKAGIVAEQRDKGETTAGCTFNVPILEGIAGTGIDLQATLQCVFIGGSSEGNQVGIRQTNANNVGNTFIGMDLEANKVQDVVVTGGSNLTFVNVNSISPVGSPNVDLAAGDNTTFVGGYVRWLNVQARSSGTALFASQVADSWGLGIRGPGAVAAFGVQKVNGSRVVTGRVGDAGNYDTSALAIQRALTAIVKATQTSASLRAFPVSSLLP